jgi:hypothetical protein
MKLNLIKNWVDRFRGLQGADRVRYGFIIFMQLALITAFAIAIYEQAWLTVFVSVVALFIMWMPSILERSIKVRLPLEFELLLNIFIYASIFLGEIRGFYTRFWWWDVVLHAGSGIALGFIGFLILYALYRSGRIQISPSLLALFSFCFALSLGAIWEIFEFAMDSLFGFNMQKSGLVDTMWDLIVDAIGAFIASISGYLYVKYRRHGIGIFEYYINAYFDRQKGL